MRQVAYTDCSTTSGVLSLDPYVVRFSNKTSGEIYGNSGVWCFTLSRHGMITNFWKNVTIMMPHRRSTTVPTQSPGMCCKLFQSLWSDLSALRFVNESGCVPSSNSPRWGIDPLS